jgi:hypothetical protein
MLIRSFLLLVNFLTKICVCYVSYLLHVLVILLCVIEGKDLGILNSFRHDLYASYFLNAFISRRLLKCIYFLRHYRRTSVANIL